MKEIIVFREDGSLKPRQRLIVSKQDLCQLIGVNRMPFTREVLTPGLYELRYTPSRGRIRIFGGEVNYLRQLIKQMRVEGRIGSPPGRNHKTNLKSMPL